MMLIIMMFKLAEICSLLGSAKKRRGENKEELENKKIHFLPCYLHQSESHQLSLTIMFTMGPIDQTPGLPVPDKEDDNEPD